MALPISVLDYSSITRALMERREWEGWRSGVRIRLVKFHSRTGETIEFSLRLKPSTWVHDRRETVEAALDECSRLIAKHRGSSTLSSFNPVPAGALKGGEWLPYKDA